MFNSKISSLLKNLVSILMPFGKAGNIYLLGVLSQGLSPIFIIPILSRKLNVNDYGEIIYVTSSASIVGIIFSLGLPIIISRTFTLHEESRYTISSWFLKVNYIYILTSIILLFVNKFTIYINILGVSLIFASMQLILPMARAQNKYVSFAIVSFLSATFPNLFILLNLEFIIFESNIKAFQLGSIILAVFSIFLVRPTLEDKIKIKIYNFNQSLKKSVIVIPHMFAIIGIMNIDKIIFGNILSKSYSGFVQIAMLVGLTPVLVLGALNHAWLYQSMNQLKQNTHEGLENLNLIIKKFMIMSFLIGIITIIFHKNLILFFNPKIIVDSQISKTITIAVLSSWLYIIYLAQTHILLWMNKFWILSIITPFSLLLQMITINYSIKYFGFISAAFGFGVAMTTIIVVVSIIFSYLKFRKPINKTILLSSLLIFWFPVLIISFYEILIK